MSQQEVVYTDANFTSGESPRVLEVASDLGEAGSGGELRNSGAGNILVEIERNEGDFTTQFTVESGEFFDLDNFPVINRIRLTHSADTAFRIIVNRGRKQ